MAQPLACTFQNFTSTASDTSECRADSIANPRYHAVDSGSDLSSTNFACRPFNSVSKGSCDLRYPITQFLASPLENEMRSFPRQIPCCSQDISFHIFIITLATSCKILPVLKTCSCKQGYQLEFHARCVYSKQSFKEAARWSFQAAVFIPIKLQLRTVDSEFQLPAEIIHHGCPGDLRANFLISRALRVTLEAHKQRKWRHSRNIDIIECVTLRRRVLDLFLCAIFPCVFNTNIKSTMVVAFFYLDAITTNISTRRQNSIE
mmetsp:Transcript_73933/g.214154  ORF Transcript_73933/g.214154 Transcript_73933/m.214154 type:complete len:261 (+) Transcript_73933:543-1325(+)